MALAGRARHFFCLPGNRLILCRLSKFGGASPARLVQRFIVFVQNPIARVTGLVLCYGGSRNLNRPQDHASTSGGVGWVVLEGGFIVYVTQRPTDKTDVITANFLLFTKILKAPLLVGALRIYLKVVPPFGRGQICFRSEIAQWF